MAFATHTEVRKLKHVYWFYALFFVIGAYFGGPVRNAIGSVTGRIA